VDSFPPVSTPPPPKLCMHLSCPPYNSTLTLKFYTILKCCMNLQSQNLTVRNSLYLKTIKMGLPSSTLFNNHHRPKTQFLHIQTVSKCIYKYITPATSCCHGPLLNSLRVGTHNWITLLPFILSQSEVWEETRFFNTVFIQTHTHWRCHRHFSAE
jgi:hypothetical protein